MKTSELAALLESLAKILRRLPDTELNGVGGVSTGITTKQKPYSNLKSVSLSRLSKYPKAELLKLIQENQIPITTGSKDSAETVFRKLKAYLQKNASSKRQIRNQIAHGRTSPELSSALAYLLRDRYE